MTIRALFVVAFGTLLSLPTARAALAQPVVDAPDRELPSWMTQWSPLAELGSISRGLPTAGRSTPLLSLPAPRIGLLWTAGNPAAVAWEVSTRRGELVGGTASTAGSYRLPLEPERVAETRIAGRGWQPLGTAGAGIGSVGVGRHATSPSSESNLFSPYASSRLVPTDTSREAVRRTLARLEGAAGWALGSWGLGLGLGYDTKTSETAQSAFVRRTRAVQPAASVGVARRWSSTASLGFHSLWQGGEEIVSLSSVGADGLAYPLTGYRDVPGIHVGVSPYYRRASRAAMRHTVSATGRTGTTQWAGYGALVQRVDRFAGVQANDPPTEDWEADGHEAGLAVQRSLRGDHAVLSVDLRFRSVTGRAALLDSAGSHLGADEWRVNGGAELRFRGDAAAWQALVRVDGFFDDRVVNDVGAALRSHLRSAGPTLSGEYQRPLGRAAQVLGGIAHTRYLSTGSIPDASRYGALYQRMFAPELDILTSRISVWAFHGALHWERADGTRWWLAVRSERARPTTPGSERAFSPSGSRVAAAVTVGVVLP